MREEGQQIPTELTIVAVLPEPETALAALHGLEAASRVVLTSHLAAIHVEVDPARLVADDEEIGIQQLRARREGSAVDRAKQVRTTFDTWSRSRRPIGARTVWRQITGDEAGSVVAATNDADLVVVARPHNLDGNDALHALLSGHHLILLVPSDWQSKEQPVLGRHIAVGWRPVSQVKEAMLLGLPWLRGADHVTLLAIDQPGADYAHDYVVRVLQQVGIETKVNHVASDGARVGKVLLDEARRLGADTLMIGAYRHGQLIEEILGGVTRDIIHQAEIPVFLAH